MSDSKTDRPWRGSAILLVDLDAFFASVEQLDHPAWRGKPVIVGGDAQRGGVVSTCSYEARKFGVRSAQAAALAKELCPHAIWTEGHFDRYREVSAQVMGILNDETPLVEQVSIDEAFLDVTPTRVNREHPADIAVRIQNRIEDIGITCSIGVGTSKSVAKVASEIEKPRGLMVVYPGSEEAFLAPLPIRSMSGIGAAAASSLNAFGIKTLGDLAHAEFKILQEVFGINALRMKKRALGLADSDVSTESEVKSVSKETTFAHDLEDERDIIAAIFTLSDQVGRRLRRKGLKGRTCMLKVRYSNREVHTTQIRLPKPTDDALVLDSKLKAMLREIWHPGVKVKLLGVGVSGFKNDSGIEEPMLFEDDQKGVSEDILIEDEEKRHRLNIVSDILKDRFGEDSIMFGHSLRNSGNTTGSSSKNPADY